MKIKLICNPEDSNNYVEELKKSNMEFVEKNPDLILYDPNYKLKTERNACKMYEYIF